MCSYCLFSAVFRSDSSCDSNKEARSALEAELGVSVMGLCVHTASLVFSAAAEGMCSRDAGICGLFGSVCDVVLSVTPPVLCSGFAAHAAASVVDWPRLVLISWVGLLIKLTLVAALGYNC